MILGVTGIEMHLWVFCMSQNRVNVVNFPAKTKQVLVEIDNWGQKSMSY